MFSFFRRKKKAEAVTPSTLPPVRAEFTPAPEAPPASPPAPSAASNESPEIAAFEALSAEELCGIRPEMDQNQIHDLLAMLFRRHNRAASSLDEQLRVEAEIMLQAIVEIRHRYLGP
jgi:hypothetical protein